MPRLTSVAVCDRQHADTLTTTRDASRILNLRSLRGRPVTHSVTPSLSRPLSHQVGL